MYTCEEIYDVRKRGIFIGERSAAVDRTISASSNWKLQIDAIPSCLCRRNRCPRRNSGSSVRANKTRWILRVFTYVNFQFTKQQPRRPFVPVGGQCKTVVRATFFRRLQMLRKHIDAVLFDRVSGFAYKTTTGVWIDDRMTFKDTNWRIQRREDWRGRPTGLWYIDNCLLKRNFKTCVFTAYVERLSPKVYLTTEK